MKISSAVDRRPDSEAVAPVERPNLIYTESSSCPMRMMRLRQMKRQRMPDVIESL